MSTATRTATGQITPRNESDERDVGSVNERRYGDRLKVLVEEQRQLRQNGDEVDDDDGTQHVLDRAQLLGDHRVAHAYVSANSQPQL